LRSSRADPLDLGSLERRNDQPTKIKSKIQSNISLFSISIGLHILGLLILSKYNSACLVASSVSDGDFGGVHLGGAEPGTHIDRLAFRVSNLAICNQAGRTE
jgi:hypothetical protein